MAFWKHRITLPIAAVLAVSFSSVLVVSHLIDMVVALGTARTMVGTLGADRINARLTLLEERLKALVDPVEEQVAHIQAAFARGEFGQGEDQDAMRTYLLGALAATPQVIGLALIHPDQSVELFGRDPPYYRVQDWSRYPQVAEGIAWSRTADRMVWARPDRALTDGRTTVITLRAPLKTPAGHVGMVAAAVTVEGLSQFVAKLSREMGETTFVLYGRDRVLAHPNLIRPWRGTPEEPLPRLDQVDDPVVAAFWSHRRAPPADVAARVLGDAGMIRVGDTPYTVMYRSAVVDGQEIVLAGYVPGLIVGDEVAALLRAAGIGLAIIVVGVGLAVWLGRVISRPMLKLAEAAEQLQTRHLEDVDPVPLSKFREVNSAATAFNQMLAALRERQRIRDLFGRYVSPAVVDGLLKDPEAALLGGQRREVSLLFTDIAGFTSLSEAYPPETVVPLLNDYLEQVCRMIAAENGIVVDFIGDAVFALFGAPIGAPDHAARALAAAGAIDAFALAFSRRAQAQGIPFGITRMGLHAGPAMVGNFGSLERLKYGAAGDTVNIASRLEGANRLFSTRRLASRRIVDKVPGCTARPLASLILRGRLEPLEVFEILGAEEAEGGWLADYRAAFALLGHEPAAAAAAFAALHERRPADPVVAFHYARLTTGLCSTTVSVDGK